MLKYVRGIELSRSFYHDVVRPILDSEFPRLEHAAALVGYGSEVLGFDSELSADHGWVRSHLDLRQGSRPLRNRRARRAPVSCASA